MDEFIAKHADELQGTLSRLDRAVARRPAVCDRRPVLLGGWSEPTVNQAGVDRGRACGGHCSGGGGPEWVDTDWETALDLVARRLADLGRRHGSDALGFLASAKCTNEENYLVQKLARQAFGTNNVDHCARLCHAPTVVALTEALGLGARPTPWTTSWPTRGRSS
jgi:anaerobic selenocysteine-containing dehydrogenase